MNLPSKQLFDYQIFGLKYIYIADVNGDSLKDIKFTITNMQCGLSQAYCWRVYLIQKSNKHFEGFSYYDYNFDEDEALNYWPERDLDSTGKFRVISSRVEGVGVHNYFVFEIYSFKDDELICDDDRFDYPIFIQYLNRRNYK